MTGRLADRPVGGTIAVDQKRKNIIVVGLALLAIWFFNPNRVVVPDQSDLYGTWQRLIPGSDASDAQYEAMVLSSDGELSFLGIHSMNGVDWSVDDGHLILATNTDRYPEVEELRLRIAEFDDDVLELSADGDYFDGEWSRLGDAAETAAQTAAQTTEEAADESAALRESGAAEEGEADSKRAARAEPAQDADQEAALDNALNEAMDADPYAVPETASEASPQDGQTAGAVFDESAMGSDDWPQHLTALLPSMLACLDAAEGTGEQVSAAWVMKGTMAGVHIRNAEGERQRCIASLDGRRIDHIQNLGTDVPMHPQEGRFVFTLGDPTGSDRCLVPAQVIIDGQEVGWISHRTCT